MPRASARSPFPSVAVLLALLVPPAVGQAPSLTWKELVLRPDLWPADCHARQKIPVRGEDDLEKGQTLPVIEVGMRAVDVTTEDGVHAYTLEPDQTDVLELAQRAYRSMSKEARDLTFAALQERADLWPDRVALTRLLRFGGGDESAKGTEVRLLNVRGDQAIVLRKPGGQSFYVPLRATDVIERARDALGKPHSGPGRIPRELEGKLVQLPSFAPVEFDPKHGPRYYAVYFSAGWCAPCRKFSPKLVDFYREQKPEHDDFEVFLVSNDHSPSAMKEYATQAGFSWLAVDYDKLGTIPCLSSYQGRGIPQLLLLDENGRVIADSFDGNEYLGPDVVLDKLRALLGEQK